MVRRAFGALVVVAGLALVGVGTAGVLAIGEQPAAASPAKGDAFTVDAVHSTVIYRVKHLNASYSYGRFNDISGTFNIAEGGSVDVTIKADSIDSANEKRDNHLKGPDFFSAKEFPEITFKSSSLKKASESTFEAAGQLTLRGVTKDITVTIEKAGEASGQRGRLQGCEAKFTIKRSDYGVSYMPQGLGEDVTILVSLEGGAK
ncbi:MAG: YceI family protein [Phycisphaerales bacterium]|nr:YceI family protein [Phycisphaerales bacterium]